MPARFWLIGLLWLLPKISGAAPSPVTVSVDWSRVIAHAGPLAYGLNGFAGFDPANASDAAYNANMAYMRPGLVRLHNWGMMEDSQKSPSGWIDYGNQAWDAAKIKRDLAVIYPYHPALMINIPGWPSWMTHNPGGFLDDDQKDAYARFCASLVHLVNKDIGRHVAYWEVTNEQDGRYDKDFHADNGNGPLKDPTQPDRVPELADIFSRCAVAMKRVDPTIHVGGPAAQNPWNLDFDRRFVRAALPHLDFFSYHAYASGSKDDPDAAIFRAPDGWATLTRSLVGLLHTESLRRHIPAIFDEYNISWTWETRDPRMTNAKGAVFDALAVVFALTSGAEATAAWNDKDGVYGKTDGADQRRPGADAFHLFNQFLIGDVVQAVSADSHAVVAFAVHGSGRHSVLLINRSDSARTVALRMVGWGRQPAAFTRHEISADGDTQERAGMNELRSGLRVPEYSLTVLTAAD